MSALKVLPTEDDFDRKDPRIHANPATPAKPFVYHWTFWATGILTLLGLAIVGVAQPSATASTLPVWVVPVGYFTALVGAMLMFAAWLRYRAH